VEAVNSIYGEISDRYLREYLKSLIDKTYKILPLKEENSPTLDKYLNSYLRELVGWTNMFPSYGSEAKIVSVLPTISYFAHNECDVATTKAEVFKCIHAIEDIINKLW
jgi:hypothetical protein